MAEGLKNKNVENNFQKWMIFWIRLQCVRNTFLKKFILSTLGRKLEKKEKKRFSVEEKKWDSSRMSKCSVNLFYSIYLCFILFTEGIE